VLAFSDEWGKIVAKFRAGHEIRRLLAGHDLAKNIIWDGIRQMTCLAGAPIARAFPVLMRTIVQFHTITLELDLGSQMLCSIYGQMSCEVLIVPFVLVNATVGQDRQFMSPAENLAWLGLESCILFMLKDNRELMKRIVALGEEIREKYAGMRSQRM
jgi:hypothetical protein